MSKKKKTQSNAKIAVIFFVLILMFVGLSLFFKLFLIVKDSKYDSSHVYNIAVSNGKSTEIISITKDNSISFIKPEENINLDLIGSYLKIPVDAKIHGSFLDLDNSPNKIFLDSMLKLKDIDSHLTVVDLVRLYFLSLLTKEKDILFHTISSNLDDASRDDSVRRVYLDSLIEKENKTIEIVNGTDISGLANRLSRLIVNMGGDVIIVATSDSPQKKSKIEYIDEKSYTVERLEEILQYKTNMLTQPGIADIRVIIGEDGLRDKSF
jgi:hypothetical protein